MQGQLRSIHVSIQTSPHIRQRCHMAIGSLNVLNDRTKSLFHNAQSCTFCCLEGRDRSLRFLVLCCLGQLPAGAFYLPCRVHTRKSPRPESTSYPTEPNFLETSHVTTPHKILVFEDSSFTALQEGDLVARDTACLVIYGLSCQTWAIVSQSF